MEDNVKMKGQMYLHQQRIGKKWKKMWAEAVAETSQSVSRLELYDYCKIKDVKKRDEGKRVIILRECVQITQREGESCPKECHAFRLETSEKIYTLCCPSEQLQSWITELCKLAFPKFKSVIPEVEAHHTRMIENSLYDTADSVRDFLVAAVKTDVAVRCKLDGEYFLTPQKESLILKNHRSREVVLSWPYHLVRKFGQDTTCFNFEAGRRCESGEGYFEFITPHGECILNIISEAILTAPPLVRSGTRPKELRSAHGSQVMQTPPETMQPSKKRVLTQSSSMSRIELSSSTKANPTSQAADFVYASVNKPKRNVLKSIKKQPQHHPDFDLWQDIHEDVKYPEPLDLKSQKSEHPPESIYSEVSNVCDFPTTEDFVDNPEDLGYFYRPEQSTCPHEDVPGDNGDLKELMDQLANLPVLSEYLEEPFNSEQEVQAPVEQSVDGIDNVGASYLPYAKDSNFESVLSSEPDCHGFSTYDNLNLHFTF